MWPSPFPRIADHKITELAELLPWNWRPARIDQAA
jgi:hypothetical protein